MGGGDLFAQVAIGECPQHADRLGRVERVVEPGHRVPHPPGPLLGLDLLDPLGAFGVVQPGGQGADPGGDPITVGARCAETAAQLLPGHRVPALPEQQLHLLTGHQRTRRQPSPAGQPRQPGAEPPPRWGAGIGEIPGDRRGLAQIAPAVGDRLHQIPPRVGTVQFLDRDHRRQHYVPTGRPAGTSTQSSIGIVRRRRRCARSRHREEQNRLSTRPATNARPHPSQARPTRCDLAAAALSARSRRAQAGEQVLRSTRRATNMSPHD